LTKDFVGLRALDSVSLTLERGEILGLIGPNGSGKTTLINVVTGFLKPTEGRVRVGDVDITGWPPHKIASLGLARTFQTLKLFLGLTVLENVEVAAVSAGLPRRQARQQAYELLESLGATRLADLPAGALPYGQERRVEIARALATNPSFLLLDEPAAGLNEAESDDLLQTLAPIPQQTNCGMMIVDHDMRLIMRLCDRLHVLNYGKTIGEGSPDKVHRNPTVIEAYLVLEDVHARYGAIAALRGISINVEQGEMVALIGVNGAGKTTTLMTIAGVLKPTQGTITFAGQSIVGQSPEEIVRKGIALVPEGRRIFPGLTVEENLRLGAAIRTNRAEVQRDIDEMCTRFPILGERLKQPGGTLSGGEQQQLAIARGLMSRPSLLMLDEPSLGLAPMLVVEIFELVAQLRETGVTLLLVEQNVERTLEIADRAYLLNTGQIEFEGPAEELRKRVDVVSTYLGGTN
jgi:ABC-type branched-subunit amino acid transport system ATPase component